MVASMLLSSVTLAAYALVESGPAFVAVAAAAGLTLGLYTPASHATIADLTEGGDRDRAFALLKVGNNAGFGAGFVVGGVLYEVAALSVFVLDGLTCAVVAGVLWYALPRLREGDTDAALRDAVGDWGRALSERRVLTLAVLNVGFAVLYAQMQTTVPVVAEETLGLTSSQLGTLYVLNPLVIVAFQLPLVAAVASWRRTRGLVVSASLWAASMLAVAAVSSVSVTLGVGLVGAFLVLRTLGEILHAPLITSLASSLGRAEDRGSQLSLLEVAKRLGFGLGSVVGGAFFDAGLQSLLWPALAGVCAVLAVGVLLLERRVTPAENGAAADAAS
jgi:MFS family permease